MKKYFVETNDYNMVVLADDYGKCYVFHETAFDEPLTIEVAKSADYSNCEGCTTAEEIINAVGTGEVYDTKEVLDSAESVIEIHLSVREMRALLNLSQQAFGNKYDIPMRTIQDWEAGRRKCPDYVLNLLERAVLEDYKK